MKNPRGVNELRLPTVNTLMLPKAGTILMVVALAQTLSRITSAITTSRLTAIVPPTQGNRRPTTKSTSPITSHVTPIIALVRKERLTTSSSHSSATSRLILISVVVHNERLLTTRKSFLRSRLTLVTNQEITLINALMRKEQERLVTTRSRLIRTVNQGITLIARSGRQVYINTPLTMDRHLPIEPDRGQ